MAKRDESIMRQIGKEAKRQTRGFPREFKRQLTGLAIRPGAS